MSNDTPKRTSFTRYRRVHDILQADNLLKTKLSKTMAAVCRPDQSHEEFPIESVYVTDEIHKQGLDAFTLPKIEVIKTAHRLLVLTPGPIPIPAPPLPPPPPKAKKAAKPKVKPKPKAKAKAKPKAAPRKPPLPKELATAEASPAAVAPKPTGQPDGCTVPPLAQPPLMVRQDAPYVVGVAALSNLEAAVLLLHSVNDPALKEPCQRIQDLIDDVHRLTVLPSAKKELSSTG